MAEKRATPLADEAFCIACGYPLHALLSSRCPECGRVFDRSDPKSVSHRYPLKRWQRSLLRPAGWLTIGLAVLGTLILIYIGGWPDYKPVPWRVLQAEFHYRPAPTAPEVLFYAAAIAWGVCILLAFPKWIARVLFVSSVARQANLPHINIGRRRWIVRSVVLLGAVWLIFGWERRVADEWIAKVRIDRSAGSPGLFFSPYANDPRVPLFSFEAADAFGAVLRNGSTFTDRLEALEMLVTYAGHDGATPLQRAAYHERDVSLLAWELQLLSLYRDPQSTSLFIQSLKHPRSQVRAAAADAIGILRHPSYSIYVPDSFYYSDELSLDTKPRIPVGGIVSHLGPNGTFAFGNGYVEHDLADDPVIKIPDSVQARLLWMMTSADTREEREAAARSLVGWPPDHYKLRVAEWGVWIAGEGHIALAEAVVDEIPPFVYKTGNPLSDFSGYFFYPSVVTKPIMHLTSDVPLAANVEVQIRAGRPWFAFPKPDDFGVGVDSDGDSPDAMSPNMGWWPPGTTMPTDDFVAPAIPRLTGAAEGYPWLLPHHRLYDSGWQGRVFIYRLGLHWQSVIVSPALLPGDVPPTVPDDPRFRWWSRLRKVPSSWVTSRGETERFLYYDGPTKARVPVSVALENSGKVLRFSAAPTQDPKDPSYNHRKKIGTQFNPILPAPSGHPQTHVGLYLDVHEGVVRGLTTGTPADYLVELPADLPLKGKAVVETLRAMLTLYGLTAEEAEGLVAAWTPQFFQTEGRRFILQMTPEEYARQCPLQMRPAPTELVRLGLVLTEFDPKPATKDGR